MSKVYLYFSLMMCCLFASQASAQGWDTFSNRGGCNQPCEQPCEQQADQACAPAEKACGDCYCLMCRYVPQCYNKTHCEMVPQYCQKKCCRQVTQCYEKQCCRMVPQYYTQTCTRQVPEYYYTTECKYVPKYTCEKCVKYVPQYYYKHVCEPTCGDRCVDAPCGR